MIYYLSTERFASTIRHLLNGNPEYRRFLALVTYEELFFERAGPAGHYIFTDFDRLTRYEIECAAAFAAALQATSPDIRILNHPLRALERYPLLVALHRAGINGFTATRLEGGGRPAAYPVFIRSEDGCNGPETDVIHDDAGFDEALADLARRGLPLRGRIAIGHAAEAGPDGFYRKYGAFNIDGRILPHHLQRNRGWVVKMDVPEHEWTTARNPDDRTSDKSVAEELAFVRDNPHREVLARAFAVAGIDFGRADYSVVGGRVQVYEINTNPSMPGRSKSDARDAIRALTRPRMLEAFRAIDVPVAATGRVRYAEIRPKAHEIRMPRWRLPASLARRAADLFRGRVPVGGNGTP